MLLGRAVVVVLEVVRMEPFLRGFVLDVDDDAPLDAIGVVTSSSVVMSWFVVMGWFVVMPMMGDGGGYALSAESAVAHNIIHIENEEAGS